MNKTGAINMQAYKLRKIIETVIYPVEDELRGIREENDKSWKKVVKQVSSVAFSGIGTTIAFQNEFLPAIIKKYSPCSDELFLFFLEFFIAIVIFIGITAFFWLWIYLSSKDNDEKKHDEERKELAEYFHKVILNNILTGISFTKRAWNKKEEYKKKEMLINCLDKKKEDYEEKKEAYRDSQKYYTKEIRLYISEALFYFKTANRQFEKKKIFEKGMRKAYVEFIDIVGFSTFKNLFDMYGQTYENMKELCNFMEDSDNQLDVEKIGKFITSKKLDLNDIEKEYLKRKR